MKRVILRSKDLHHLLEGYNVTIAKKDIVELVDERIIFVNKNPSFFYYEKKLVPTLHLLQEKKLLRNIVVDMGAVKFLVGGADVMRPGVKEIDSEIRKGDFVVIIDIEHRKALVVGLALFDAQEMQGLVSGRVVKNIHYIGDAIWKFS